MMRAVAPEGVLLGAFAGGAALGAAAPRDSLLLGLMGLVMLAWAWWSMAVLREALP